MEPAGDRSGAPWRQFPLLTALEGRGPFLRTGEPLSFLRVEVRGGTLFIAGETPMRYVEGRGVLRGAEYEYILESKAAERLLAALARDFPGDLPERVIAREFEFGKSRCFLAEYLDSLRLDYIYH